MKSMYKTKRGNSSGVLRERGASKLIVKHLKCLIKKQRSEGGKQHEAILKEIEKLNGLVEVIAAHLKRQEDAKPKPSSAPSA